MIGPTEKLKELQGTAQRNFLPGSHALLVSIRGENASERRIQVLTSADGVLQDVTEGTNPAYTASGDLLFLNGGQLWSAPLDLKRLTLSAPPSPVLLLAAFPGPGAKIAISSGGGRQVAWSRDGREIFYRRADTMMAVPVGADPTRAGLRGRYLSSRDPSMVTMPIESSTTQPPTAGFWRCARAEGRATTRYESSPIGSRR